MDANAHSRMWGSSASNPRGDMIEEFIFHHDLSLCNKGTQPTFVARGTSTIIDITLCSRGLVDNIKGWKVDTRDQMSDHRRIIFRLDVEAYAPSWGWVTKKADWCRFSSLMSDKSTNFRSHRFWTANTLDREVGSFYNDLKSCLSKVCPRIRVRKRQTNSWWNDDLASQRRRVRHLQQQVMKDRENFALWVHYKEARNKFCSAIRKAKRLAWKSFTEEATSLDGMMKVSRAILQQRPPQVGHLRKQDGSYTQNRGEVLDTLLDAFFPDSTEYREVSTSPIDYVLRSEISNLCTPEKLKVAFKSFKKEKSPGPDGIRPVVLQNLDGASLGRLALLCNISLSLGYVPKRWRGANAVLIPKVGKSDYSSPRSFRPISLTSFLFKGMERVVAWHLEEVGVVDSLSPHQHAFRKGKSTATCLSEVVDIIEASILRGKLALGVFFDIEGAFDNVLTSKTLEGLNAKGVPQDIIKWYGFYLTNRFVQVSLGNTSRCRSLTRGTPQGGILSPLVWNIVFDSLLDKLAGIPGVKPTGYADDGMFLVTGICPKILLDLAQPAINMAVEWGRDNGLVFSHKKTQVILFKRKNKVKVEGNLYINGSKIPFSDEVTYLGLTLNERLNWNTHVIKKVNKCKGKLCMLRSALGVRWGPSPRMMLWAYESLIVPSLTHGALVWAQSQLNKSALNKLGQLNRLAAIMTSPIKKSTPTAGLEVILGLKPLDLAAKESGLSDSLRLKPRIRWDGIGHHKTRGHIWTWLKWGAQLELGKAGPDRTGLRHFNWDPPCSLVDNFVKNKDTTVCAVSTEQVGDSTRFNSIIEGGNLSGLVTHRCIVMGQNPQCLYKGFELIMRALGHLVERGERVVILSRHRPISLQSPVIRDSKSKALLLAMSALAKKSGNKILLSSNKTLLDKHRSVLSVGVGVDWNSVPKHLALQSGQVVKLAIKGWGDCRWQLRWALLSSCRQTKAWFPTLRKDKTPQIRRLNRYDLGHLIHFITGHNNLLRHQCTLGAGEVDVCRLCGVGKEDATHLWVNCVSTRDLREGGPTPGGTATTGPIAWSFGELSRFLRESLIVGLLDQVGTEHPLSPPCSGRGD